jgi:hypothetical protein
MDVKDILIETMKGYAGQGLNGISYLTLNDAQNVFAIVSVSTWKGEHFADSSLIVRLQRDWILIERDMNSDILMEALVEAGIPRKKIICVYAGETLSDDDVFKDILQQQMEAHAAHISGYFTLNEAENLFIVTRRTNGKRKASAETEYIARFTESKVVIEYAPHSQFLADALVVAGIPVDRIVLSSKEAPEPLTK